MFLFSAYFGMILLLSLWLNIDATYTPLWISLLMAHMAIAGGILFFVLKKWFCHVASLRIVLIATALFAISCFYSTDFNAEINFGRLAISRVIAGFGLAFFLYPLLFTLLKKLPEKLHPQGLAIFQSLRLLSGSLGCAVYTTIWFRRRSFYHERLGEQLTIYSKQTQQFFSNISFFGVKGVESEILLNQALDQQADVLALADTFYLMGWLMVGVFVITLTYLIIGYCKRKAAGKPAAFTSEN
jgi:DHA2 family multidrug resistance protein